MPSEKSNNTPVNKDSESWVDTDFALAFSDKPNGYSPEALVLYLTQKGCIEECSMSTVDSVYSAFKDYWKYLYAPLASHMREDRTLTEYDRFTVTTISTVVHGRMTRRRKSGAEILRIQRRCRMQEPR